MEPISINVLGCCMSRDIFNIGSPIEYSIKAFVQRQNPFLMFQKPVAYTSRDQFDKYYEDMKEHRLDCPLTNRMYHDFNRRSMLTLINGSGPSRLLDNKGDWIVLDTHYAQSPEMWYLRSDNGCRMFQSSYSCYLDTVVDLIPHYKDSILDRVQANVNMTLMADTLCEFLKDNWQDRIILLNSRPADLRSTDAGDVPMNVDPSFRSSSEHMCKVVSDRIPVHILSYPDVLKCRDGNFVHYTEDILRWFRNRIDSIITDIT